MRKFVKETGREYFPSAREDEDNIGFQGAVVLIAALVAGTNVENLTAWTGYPHEFVVHISFRARSAGLWVNERVSYEQWFEGDSVKPMAILCDVMVVEGELIRIRNEDGKFRYKAA